MTRLRTSWRLFRRSRQGVVCLAVLIVFVVMAAVGPFVVGPVIERRIGVGNYAALAIDAAAWRDAEWAHQRGLYAELQPDGEALDARLAALARQLAASNPEAMAAMKRVFWQGTEHWPELLAERARMSGRLVVSGFARQAIERVSN